MATISHNDRAPSDAEVTYSLGSAEPFTLQGSGSYEVDEPSENADPSERVQYDLLIGNARSHPWLKVEIPEPALDEDSDQPLTLDYPKTAIDAGLDQDDVEFEGKDDNIAETLAADEAQGDEPIVVDDPNPDDDEPVLPAEDKE